MTPQRLVCLAATALAAVVGAGAAAPPPFTTLSYHTIFQPVVGQIIYPRHAELSDGTLLVTASLYGGNIAGPFSDTPPGPDAMMAYFPIFASHDGGVTWQWISNVTDTRNGLGMGAQPALLELSEPLGGYDAGTVLCAGNSWGPNATHIDLYASKNKGKSWEFVSNVASGGRPNTTNGADPIWEPFLM